MYNDNIIKESFWFTRDWFNKYSNGSQVNVDWLSRQVLCEIQIYHMILKMHYIFDENTCILLIVQLVRSFILCKKQKAVCS